jgi:hypothetical protein
MVKVAALIFIILQGCRGEEHRPEVVHEGGGGRVIAVAEGVDIHAPQLREASKTSGLPPREALDRMIDEVLLSLDAEEKGYLENNEVAAVWKKALVQKMLEVEVEKRVPENSVTPEDVRTYYQRSYAGAGMLLEQAYDEIRKKLLAERRQAAYDDLVRALEETYEPRIYHDRVERLQ